MRVYSAAYVHAGVPLAPVEHTPGAGRLVGSGAHLDLVGGFKPDTGKADDTVQPVQTVQRQITGRDHVLANLAWLLR